MDPPQNVSMFTTIFFNLDGWRPQYGTSRLETWFFDQVQDSHFFSLCLAYFVNLLVYLWIIDIISFYIIFCEDEDREMINFPLIKSTKVWM